MCSCHASARFRHAFVGLNVTIAAQRTTSCVRRRSQCQQWARTTESGASAPKAIRDWLVIERAARDSLRSTGMSDEAQDSLIGRMKSFHELLNSVDFSFSIDAAFPGEITESQRVAICEEVGQKRSDTVGEKLRKFVLDLWDERIQQELEACGEIGYLPSS
jgi:hypothetical protein